MEERMERIGRILTDFFFCHSVGIGRCYKKNPLESAPSVLPLYHHFSMSLSQLSFQKIIRIQ